MPKRGLDGAATGCSGLKLTRSGIDESPLAIEALGRDRPGEAGCPQRDSNPCRRLERAVSWAARRWGPGPAVEQKKGPGMAGEADPGPRWQKRFGSGACRIPVAAAARLGQAPSYCHLYSHYAIGPPPFRSGEILAGFSDVGHSSVGRCFGSGSRGRESDVLPGLEETPARAGPGFPRDEGAACRRPYGTTPSSPRATTP